MSTNELVALSIKILKEVENIDRKLGYPPHQIDTPAIAKTVSNSRLEELYVDFLDWYNIIPGPGKSVYDHVLKKYPKEKYNRILCVGDGIKSHLGRKLAMKGYNVVSVDPEADTTLPLDEETLKSGGMFIASKDFFIVYAAKTDTNESTKRMVILRLSPVSGDLLSSFSSGVSSSLRRTGRNCLYNQRV